MKTMLKTISYFTEIPNRGDPNFSHKNRAIGKLWGCFEKGLIFIFICQLTLSNVIIQSVFGVSV